MKETQLQRVVRRTEKGEIGKGLLRISYNGFSASQFFDTEKELENILQNTNAKDVIKLLSKISNKNQ